jgi:hypothetical protein
MRGAWFGYNGGNLKGSNTSNLRLRTRAIGGRAFVCDGLGELCAEEKDLRLIVRPEYQDDQRAGRPIG